MKITMATYLPARFRVAKAAMKPTVATILEIVMCQVLSLNLPEDQDTAMVIKPAIRYGGHVRTSVIVLLKPRVLTTVGKKFYDCQQNPYYR